jgi:hypothetical protein
MGELGRTALPRAIPADELQAMLGPSGAFCSWDTSNSPACDFMARWPYLFSHPLLSTDRKTPQ